MSLKVVYPETPKGKRTYRINVYGNIIGYVSGKRFWEFGCNSTDENDAIRWISGESLKCAITGEE